MSPSAEILRRAKDTLAKKGKTFNWAKRLLSTTHGDRATRLYAFCRHLDDLADERVSVAHARAQLMEVSEALSTGRTTDPVISDALSLMTECGIDRRIPQELINGLLTDLEEVKFKSEEELLRYCYRVAGTVGLMMSDVLDVKEPEAAAYAMDLGIAMQLTNICRDIQEDAQMGRRYLPSDIFGDLSTDDLIKPPQALQQPLREGVKYLLRLADTYYRSGESGLPFLPLRARHGILIAARVYRAIGWKLRSRGCNYWQGRVSVPLSCKIGVTLAALGGSLFTLGFWRNPKVHRAELHRVLRGLPRVDDPGPEVYDVVILGGGCAGLSLAMRLAEMGERCPRVAIIEKRGKYVHDRIWSYWANEAAQLKHLARKAWGTVVVSGDGKEVRCDCRTTPYQTIESGTFYEAALATIGKNPRITLLMSEDANGVFANHGGIWQVELKNQRLGTRQIIDTRPARNGKAVEPLMWQSFSGVELECDAEVFDGETATLMEFIKGTDGQITFLYLLPFSSKRALVEVTVFGPQAHGPLELSAMLNGVIRRLAGSHKTQIIYREHHAIPMGLPPFKKERFNSYVQVGLEAGGARPSTGYVFQRIQLWADGAAERIGRGLPAQPHARDPWAVRKMDGLFLRVLSRAPERAAEIFTKLFAMRDVAPVIRFMNDEAGVLDYLKVMRALPSGIFLKEMVKGIWR